MQAPYPADTRAKGWRFELDYEQIEQSSTWALAGAEARPWLLMMWMTSWRQVPCGSLPDDPEVIAALIGMPPKTWAKLSKIMLRGWSLADDGRLYHATVSARVLEMLDYRKKNAERVAKFKAAKREELAGNALPTREQQANNDTGTGTGTIKDSVPNGTSSSARKPRASRKAPEGFEPSAELLVWASREAPGVDVRRELEKFRDYEFKTPKSDWTGAFRNWLRTASGSAPQRGNAASESPYARRMREQYESFAPEIAAKRPAAETPLTVEMETPNAIALR
jgi:hypothetical protein